MKRASIIVTSKAFAVALMELDRYAATVNERRKMLKRGRR